ncbi:MAG: hypothetical protein ACTHMC_07095 [Pseudobacter sp.]|uniref:hypothetical protein n=1 Tax=Pseudobacter sp. TaxID=2045420 RepID=UPI003F80E6BF
MFVTTVTGIISSWSTLFIPLLFFLLRPQRLVRANWPILLFSLVHFITGQLHDQLNSAPFHHQFNFCIVLIEYGLLAWLLFLCLRKPRNKRWVSGGSGLLAILITTTLLRPGSFFYSSIGGISVILLISFSMFFFMEWITAETFEPINTRPEFWMVTGVLFYVAGNFFYFISLRSHYTESLLIHHLVNLLRNACFVMAIVQSRAISKSGPLPSAHKF